MKRTLANTLRSGLALVLVFCLTFGLFGGALATTVAAEETDTKTINYVSLGDSMTNGYGLEGYDGNTGAEDYGYGSYANLFEQWLEEEYSAEVNHAQLAMSAMRAEDLHWLLELDYTDAGAIAITDGDWKEDAWNAKFTTGDYWTWNELCDDYRFAVAAYAIKNDGAIGKITDDEAAIVAEYAQNAVKNADIISLGMGNGNFGVFMFGRILEAIGFGGEPSDAMIYDVKNAIRECDAATQTRINALISKMYAAIESKLGVSVDSNESLNALVNTVVYTGVSYVLNYAGSVEAILQLNPDAEIILVALMNTYKDNKEIAGVTIGDLLDAVFVPLNAYIAALPTYMQAVNNGVYADAKFYYAEAPHVACLVDEYGNDFKDEDGKWTAASTIRDRFVDSIVGYCDHDKPCADITSCNEWEEGMVWGLMGDMELVDDVSLTRISLADVVTYNNMTVEQKAAWAANPKNLAKAVSINVYLAFENAVIASKEAPVSLESVMGLGGLSVDMFGSVMEDFKKNAGTFGANYATTATAVATEMAANAVVGNLSDEAKDMLNADAVKTLMAAENLESAVNTLFAGVAQQQIAVAEGTKETVSTAQDAHENEENSFAAVLACENSEHTSCATVKKAYNNALNTLISTYEETLVGAINTAKGTVTESIPMLCMLLSMPEALSASLQKSTAVSGLLALFARCVIGNGLGGHPSASGHNSLFEAVKKAYDEEFTAADQTKENLIVVAEKLAELTAEYYDEAYAYAYAEAKNAGYIDDATAAIDDVIKALAAIDVSGTEMTDAFKAELAGEIEEIVETLTAAKALIAEADVLDDAALTALMAMLDEAGEAIENLLNVIAQAGEDTNDMVVTPALKDAQQKLNTAISDIFNNLSAAVKAGTDKLLEKLGDAYDKFVAAVKEASKNINDTAEQLPDWIYDYLYNNAAKVLAMLNEYGNDALEYLSEYKDEALKVLAYVAKNFGEEMLNFVLDNAEEIFNHCVELLKEHGDKAWDLIKAYLNELDNLDEVAMDALAAAAEAVKKLAAQYAKEAYEYAYNYAKDKGYIDAVVNALEDLNAKLDAAAKWAEANKQALAEMYESVMEEINNAKALIAEIKATIKNAVELGVDTVEKIQKMLDELSNTLETVADLLRSCDCNLGEEAWSFFQNTVKPAIIEKLTEAVKAGSDWLLEKLGETYDAFVDAVVEAAKEYAPEVADWIYDYLYNNPAEVIAFLNEYGDDAIAFLNEFKEETMLVLGFVAVTYGEDALEYVMDNAEEILEKTVAWLDKHGENAWKLIKVYLDELGLLEEIPEIPEIGDIKDALDQVTDLLDKFIPTLEDKIEDLGTQAAEKLQDAVQDLIDVIEGELKNATGAAKEKLEELYNAAKDLQDTIEQMIKDGTTALIGEVMDAVNDVIDTAKDAAQYLSDKTIEKINEIIDDVKAAVSELYKSATHDTYVVTEDSYYVAIGDGTAVSESYVDQLAAELDVEYNNLAENGMLIADVYELLDEEKAEIEKADLITLGFGSNSFVNFAIDRVVDGLRPGKYAELDWTGYVGEENLPKVEEALGEVNTYFVEQDLGTISFMGKELDLAQMMTAVVEGYAYAAVSYACDLPEVVNEIHEINPDAVVIIVGMYNPLENIVLEMGETTIEFGEYVDYLVTAANIHNFTYALLTDNAIFVEAEEVETVVESKNATTVMDITELLMEYLDLGGEYSGESMNPSENGHEYIKDQILNSLTVYDGEIIDNGRTLSLEGVVYINQYVKIRGFEGVDPATDGGLLIWTDSVTEEEATFQNADKVVEGLKKGDGEYGQQTHGIAAKEYADTLYLRVYLELTDGTYAYGPLKEYSVRHYCESRVEKGTDLNLRQTCIDMLHYGASAQIYFDYNTADLANKNIAAENPSTAWDANMLTPVKDFTTNITASSNIRSNGKTLALDGAVCTNYYYIADGIEVAEAEILVWDGVTEELTVDNVTYTKQMIAGNGEYGGQAEYFAAKEYSKTIFTCAHFVDSEGNDHYSEIVAYSPEAYAASRIEKSTDAKMVTMMKQMVIYGESAYVYFSNKK